MTGPMVQPPNISQGPVIQDPGLGGAMAGALGQVLAAMQQKREEEYRQQVLAQRTSEAQAQADYQRGLLSAQTTETARKSTADAQVGGFLRRTMGGPQPADPGFQRRPSSAAPLGTPRQESTAIPLGGGQPSIPGTQTQSGTGLFHDVFAGGSAALAPAEGHADIFGGVSDENVPAAVQGLQEVQALQPKAAEPTTDVRNFAAWAQLNGIDPAAAQKFWELIGPKPGVTVNNNAGKAETAYGVEGAKADVAERTEAVHEANLAASSFPSMNEAYKLFQDGKVLAGLGQKQVLGIHRLLSTMGVDTSKLTVEDTQTATKLLRDGVLAQLATRALGSGTAVSDADRQYMEQVQGADLTQEPGAIKRIIRINVGLSIERMTSAKMLLEQQMMDHPESAGVLRGRIALIDKKFAPIWKQYETMVGEEAKQQANSRRTAGIAGDSLFPVRR